MLKRNQRDTSEGFKVNVSPNSLAAPCLDLYTSTDFRFYDTQAHDLVASFPDIAIKGSCLILKSQTVEFPFTKISCFSTVQISVNLLVASCSSESPKSMGPSLWHLGVSTNVPHHFLFSTTIPRSVDDGIIIFKYGLQTKQNETNERATDSDTEK